MNLNINPDWLRRMADKEANGVVSVGGLVAKIEAEGMVVAPRAAVQKAAEFMQEFRRQYVIWNPSARLEWDRATAELLAALETPTAGDMT